LSLFSYCCGSRSRERGESTRRLLASGSLRNNEKSEMKSMSSRNVSLSASGFDASAEELSDLQLNVDVSPVNVLKEKKEETYSSCSTDFYTGIYDDDSSFFADSEEDDADLSFVVNYFAKKVKGGLTAEEWAKSRVSQEICTATGLDGEDAGKIADNALQRFNSDYIFGFLQGTVSMQDFLKRVVSCEEDETDFGASLLGKMIDD